MSGWQQLDTVQLFNLWLNLTTAGAWPVDMARPSPALAPRLINEAGGKVLRPDLRAAKAARAPSRGLQEHLWSSGYDVSLTR